VQGEDRWRTPEDTWIEMEEIGEEVFFVNVFSGKRIKLGLGAGGN
jgi:hypothetical protein